MQTEADRLIAEARELQETLNVTLNELQKLGVVCHSVCSYRGYGTEPRCPLPTTRVQLVLEMKLEK